MRRFISAFVLIATLSWVGIALAGGPIGAVGTTARRYSASAMPISYKTDRGGLGSFSNTTSTAIASYAFTQWGNVSSAALSFSNGGQLSRDVTTSSDSYISGSGQWSDGVNPVVFDSSGSITDARIGSGAKNQVLGFATSAWSGTTLVEGYAIINGYLSGSGGTTDQQRYKATITHEIGHFLGLAHPQNSMRGDYPTMYPVIFSPSQQMTLSPDDTSAIAILYPASGFLNSVGTISGTVKTPSGTNLSGVSVIAVDSATGASYSSVVDYYSGNDSNGFTSKPTVDGSYTIKGLPPATYYVRMEPVNSSFSGGSRVASYNTPSNTSARREWYNGASESGDMLEDNSNQKVGVHVSAAGSATGIDLVENQSSTLSTMSYDNGTASVAWSLPGGPSNSITKYAVRFTAPAGGSLLGVRFYLQSNSSMPLTGVLTVGVYTNASGGIGGVPGTLLGSVAIPYSDLASNEVNEVWLRGLGTTVNFASGSSFHVVFSTNGVGSLVFDSDNGSTTSNRSSYYTSSSGWRNFPTGYSSGAPAWNLLVTGVWSTTPAGNPAPEISLSPTMLSFGRVRPGSHVDKTITLTNSGDDTLNVSSTTISGSGSGAYSIVSGGGTYSVLAGASHSLTVRFAPMSGATAGSSGLNSAILSIASDAATSPDRDTLIGYGVMPRATTISSGVAFGSTRTGDSVQSTRQILRNTGNDTLHVSGISLSGDTGAFTLLSPSGSTLLPPDSILSATIHFMPTTRRSYAATLQVSHDDSAGSSSVSVSGTGVAPVIGFAPDSIDFGSVAVGSTFDNGALRIWNEGDAPLALRSMTMGGSDSASFTLLSPTSVPDSIAPGDTVAVALRFHPVSRRSFRGTLRINHDAGTTPSDVLLSGRGIAPVLVVPTSWNAGSERVGSSVVRAGVLLRNGGDAPLVIRSAAISGSNAGDFFIGSIALPDTVAAGDSLQIPIRFAPVAAGIRAATLSISDNDPSLPGATISLSGTATQGDLQFEPWVLDFGDVLVGTTFRRSVVLRNVGSDSVTIGSIDLPGALFTLQGAAIVGRSLAAGDTMMIPLEFAPAVEGAQSTVLTLHSDGATPALDITLEGRGVLPGLSLSRSLIDFGIVAASTMKSAVVTIHNSGTIPLTNVTLTLDGADTGAFAVSPASGSTIAPGDSLPLTVTLTAPSTDAVLAATLHVTSGGSERTVAISATVVAGGITARNAMDFGTTTTTQVRDTTVMVRNQGSVSVTIDSLSLSAMRDGSAGSFFVASTALPMTIGAGDSASIDLRFAPAGIGLYEGALTIHSNSLITPEVTVELHARVSEVSSVEATSAGAAAASVALLPLRPNPARGDIDARIRISGSGRLSYSLTLVNERGIPIREFPGGVIVGTGGVMGDPAPPGDRHHPVGPLSLRTPDPTRHQRYSPRGR